MRAFRGRPVLLAFLLLAACAAAGADLAARFLAEMAKKAAAGQGSVIPGRQGWLYFRPELRGMGAGRFWGESAARASRAPAADADPLPAILDFKAQLDRAGIALLYVPVPAKATVYPEHVSDLVKVAPSAPPPRLDPHHQEFYRLLESRGVPVLDLLPTFLAERGGEAPLYCRQDTHWSGRACALAASQIAQRIGRPAWLAAQPKRKYATREQLVEITGDLWRDHPSPKPPKEKLRLTLVGEPGPSGLEPPRSTRDSPVLLLGDSHNLVFHAGGEMHARGAGLADHLAHQLGFPLDVVAVMGSGATPSRVNLLRRGDNLKGKKLVIWCLSVRELTEGQGWKKVPVIR